MVITALKSVLRLTSVRRAEKQTAGTRQETARPTESSLGLNRGVRGRARQLVSPTRLWVRGEVLNSLAHCTGR